ncbi:MAG: nucleotide exchange factor GrpE [Defluviitaleaceae bacterium]|nr:nucleotide exchange factor GrpE [Defluviitaleaceae bacterium]
MSEENEKDEDLQNLEDIGDKEGVDDLEILDAPEQEEDKTKELTDKLQRTMAEFDNFRKRTMKEKISMYDDGVRDTIDSLLPVIDNFTRAAKSLDEKDDVHKGIIMIYKQFENIMEQIGIEKIDVSGEFDPNIHNAVSTEDNANFKSGEIIEELQQGYKYKEKIIRHSYVKVAN